MQRITPFLWYDNNAQDAANFYVTIFTHSGTNKANLYNEESSKISGKPKGTVMTVPFVLKDLLFIALNGGPYFKFNPAISFFISCTAEEEVNKLYNELSSSGKVLMELGKYPFSDRFGWVQDRFGLSWQLNLTNRRQKITPFLMFTGKSCGRAEEAINFYVSLFENSEVEKIEKFDKNDSGLEGKVKHAVFKLEGMDFMALDNNIEKHFTFNEAISFVVNCDGQDEIDYFWNKLSEGGDLNAQQCGWLKDKFGVSWQIVPTALEKLFSDVDSKKSERVMHALLQMKKIDIMELKKAYEQQ